jgi:transcriptional regulator with XRE-family HTH domain
MGYTFRQRTAAEIRAEMARQRKTQADLAEVLGLSQMAVSRRLNAEVDTSLDEIADIAEWLGVTFAQMVTPAGAA